MLAITLMRNISFYIISILPLVSCESKNNNNNNRPSLTINYDYNKGFEVDTLKLNIDRKTFSSKIETIFNQQIEAYSFLLISKDFMKIYEHPKFYINNVIA